MKRFTEINVTLYDNKADDTPSYYVEIATQEEDENLSEPMICLRKEKKKILYLNLEMAEELIWALSAMTARLPLAIKELR